MTATQTPGGWGRHPVGWSVGVALFWILLFGFGGVFFSGPHIRDDHGQFRMLLQFESGHSLLQVVSHWVRGDLATRFRPLLPLILVVRTWVFGVNFFPQFLINCVAAIVTSVLGVRIAGQLGFSKSEGLTWIFLTLIGGPAVVWWFMGIPESWAMLALFSGVTLILDEAMGTGHGGKLILGLLGIVLATMAKESFILMVPAVIGLRWRVSSLTALPTGRLYRRWPDLFLAGVAITELGWIKTHVPLDQGPYGVDPLSMAIFERLGLTVGSLFFSGGIGLALIALVGMTFLWGKRRDTPSSWQGLSMMSLGLFAALIIVPQVSIYAKSGIFERYLLPGRWGTAILLISYLRYVRHHYAFPLISENVQRNLSAIAIVVGGVSCIVSVALIRWQGTILSMLSRQRQLPVQPLWAEKLIGIQVVLAVFGIFIGIVALFYQSKNEPNRLDWIWGRWILPLLVAGNMMFAFGAARIFSGEGHAIQDVGKLCQTLPQNVVIVCDPVFHSEALLTVKYYLLHSGSADTVKVALVDPDVTSEKVALPVTILTFPGFADLGRQWLGPDAPSPQYTTPAGYAIWVIKSKK